MSRPGELPFPFSEDNDTIVACRPVFSHEGRPRLVESVREVQQRKWHIERARLTADDPWQS
jgi:hypothetical protein